MSAAAGQLPKSLPMPPTYRKTNPADSPILILGLQSDVLPIDQVDDYADTANTMVELTRMFGHSARAVYSTKAALEAVSA